MGCPLRPRCGARHPHQADIEVAGRRSSSHLCQRACSVHEGVGGSHPPAGLLDGSRRRTLPPVPGEHLVGGSRHCSTKACCTRGQDRGGGRRAGRRVGRQVGQGYREVDDLGVCPVPRERPANSTCWPGRPRPGRCQQRGLAVHPEFTYAQIAVGMRIHSGGMIPAVFKELRLSWPGRSHGRT